MGRRKQTGRLALAATLSVTLLVACVAPAPTATPTSSPAAAAVPAKEPAATPTKRPLVKVRWATTGHALTYASSYLAMAKGFYHDEGLDAEQVFSGGGPQTIAAIASGDVEFGMGSGESFVAGAAAGVPVLIFGQTGRLAIIVTMRKDVAERLGVTQKSPIEARSRALKGLTITSASAAGATGRVVRLMMQLVSLDPDRDAEFTYIQDAEAGLAALKQGHVDVISRAPPQPLVPVAEGWGEVLFVFGQERLPGLEPSFNVLTTSGQYADSNRDALEAIIRANWRGLRLLKENIPEAARTLKETEAFQELELSVVETSLRYLPFSRDPSVTPEVVQVAIDLVNADRPPDNQISVTFEQAATNRFVEAAKKQLGF